MFPAKTITFSFVLFLIMEAAAQSQECVQNLPGFANQGGDGGRQFRSGTQAIIPDYCFDCHGNVTHWGAFVEPPGRNELHTLVFQVWRRTGGGQGTTGCYDLVGDNNFPSISPASQSQGQILTSVPVEQQIEVHPGDVIGFYYAGARDEDEDSGVELQRASNPPGGHPVVVTAWYGPFPTNLSADSCMIQVGRDSEYDLRSSTTAAPIITASVAAFIPPPSQTSSPSPSTSSSRLPAENVLATVQPPPLMITQTGTPQTTQTLQTQAPVQFSVPSTPQSTPFLPPPIATIPPVGSGLELGTIVAIVIVVLIVLILVFILALALRRMAKKQVQMVNSQDNPEYSDSTELNASASKLEHFEMNTNDAYGTNTAEITTTENVAYMTMGDAIPVTQNVAYEPVTHGTDECYEYVICDEHQ